MAKHMVKCPICGLYFDANVEPFTMVSATRYAHVRCAEEDAQQKEKIQKDQEALNEYIKQLFHVEKVPERINRQIRQYVRDNNYSYSGILKTLKYWFEIKNGDLEKTNGGIGK